MNQIKFTIPGDPVGKARPRATATGNFVRMYTPKKTTQYEELVRRCFAEAGGKISSGPVRLSLSMYSQMPQSWSKKKLQELAYTGCEKKPDIDNVIKIIGDALNGVAYKDDSSIVSVTATKQWAAEGCVVVSLESANNPGSKND